MSQEEPPDRNADYLRFRETEHADVVAYLCHIGFARHVADEAANDALAELYWSWSEVHTDPRMWIRTTARRIAGKTAKASPGRLLTRLLAKGARPEEGHHDSGIGEVVERHGDLVSAINSLPMHQREVIALRLSGFTNKEIAIELKIAERTVQDRVKRAGARVLLMLDPGEEIR